MWYSQRLISCFFPHVCWSLTLFKVIISKRQMSTSWTQPRNYIQRYRLKWIIRLFFMLILILIYHVSSNPSESDMIFPYYWKPAASIYHLAVGRENTFLQCCTTSTTSSSSLLQGASGRRRDYATSVITGGCAPPQNFHVGFYAECRHRKV